MAFDFAATIWCLVVIGCLLVTILGLRKDLSWWKNNAKDTDKAWKEQAEKERVAADFKIKDLENTIVYQTDQLQKAAKAVEQYFTTREAHDDASEELTTRVVRDTHYQRLALLALAKDYCEHDSS